ncbi:hypothetical protein PAECIP111893_00604 [Paenibacillus plantiphilus]|uniref:HipA-like kinase domain-containing protein n=1 Tax=Paenibacillus plantiphilus TaxID=2905650 RepID=A0ABM9BU22_9BACL|nr:hypothetical protein PAECIP111893_00604 [Paenibacillus plantiphilus]
MIQVTQYVKPLDGWSRPHLMLCDDGNFYVIKLLSNPQGVKVLVNEFICSQLAKQLNLPIPEGKILFISKRVINSHPTLKSVLQEGPHFGSRFIPSGIHQPTCLDLARCTNIEQAADMIVFDYWLDNNDRHVWRPAEQNLIVTGGSEPKIWMIDQANVFNGPAWSIESLIKKMNIFNAYWGTLYQRFVPFIDGPNPFRNSVSKFQSLTKGELFNVVFNIPAEWNVSEQELTILVNYMEHRRKVMYYMIQSVHVHFPIWHVHYLKHGGIG